MGSVAIEELTPRKVKLTKELLLLLRGCGCGCEREKGLDSRLWSVCVVVEERRDGGGEPGRPFYT